MITVGQITKQIESFAPKYLAEDWDPIGLSFGSKDKEVKKMMIALDLDQDTLKEAQEKNIDFIFTHHPAIFSPLKTLNEDHSRRKEYIELIRANIALYSAHTNIDAADNGMNDWLAEALGLETPYDVVEKGYQESLKQLVLYTPHKDAEAVKIALHQIGAGQVGDYKDVSYTTEGKGHFTPQSQADPTIGETNKAETVAEERVEMLFPNHLLGKIIQTIYKVHPYEEPIYNIIDVGQNEKIFGIGRVGNLKESISFSKLIDQVKVTYDLPFVRYATADLETEVNRIAVLGGSGEKYYQDALNKGADVFITGDISYHGAQDMIRDGLLFIDAGHFIENIFVEKMTEILKEWNTEYKWDIEIIPTESQTDVFLHR